MSRFVALAVAALTVALVPVFALARAGGGDNYPSGGGSGGGGGGGGGGGDAGALFYLLWQLIRLCIYYPQVGIPVLIVVVIVLVYMSRQGHEYHHTRVIRRGGEALHRLRDAESAGVLRAADPAFDEPAFLARAGHAFAKIQHAWGAQDLNPVRPFISDAVYERFSLQIAEQRDLGYRNELHGVRVHHAELADARADALFQTAAVRVTASAADFKVSLSDGRRISGSNAPQTFVEIWSFLRRAGAASLPAGKPGLIEGNCPNCGVSVEMNQSAQCTHCGALLRSGRHDWVLVEITQEVEWRPTARHDPPGVAALRRRDPGFSPQELEDRASVMFWRRVMAERLGTDEPLRKIATPEYCERFTAGLRADRGNGHGRSYWGDCGVGSVETVGVVADGETDRALVEVRWAGTRYVLEPGAGRHAARKTDQTTLRRTLFVLSRSADARSNADQSVSSAHCPNCGAPEVGGASHACEYCGVVLNDGRHGWVLVDTVAANSGEAGALLDQLHEQPAGAAAEPGLGGVSLHPVNAGNGDGHANGHDGAYPGTLGLLAWMIKAALADGQASDAELHSVRQVAARRYVPPEQVESMVRAAQAGQLDVPEPRDRDEARGWLAAMASVALADGKVSGEEYDLLRTAGQRSGLSDYDVKLLLKRTRGEAYGQATAALRAEKTRRKGGNGNGTG